MSDSRDPPPDDLLGSIWAVWRDVLGGGDSPGATAFAGGDMDGLAQRIKGATRAHLSGDAGESFAKMVDASAAYGHLAEQVWALVQKARDGSEDWKRVLREGLGGGTSEGEGSEGEGDAWAGFARQWGLPEDAWRAFETQVRKHPLNMAAVFSGGEQAREAWQAAYGQGGGDWTRRMGRWGELQGAYARALERYQSHLGKASSTAMKDLAEQLIAREEGGEPLDSLREVYDLSVDCGEASYAALNEDADFNAAQAELTNALMALRAHEQETGADLLATFGVPTRDEMNAALKGLHDLRREVRRLSAELTEARAEIDRLSAGSAPREKAADTGPSVAASADNIPKGKTSKPVKKKAAVAVKGHTPKRGGAKATVATKKKRSPGRPKSASGARRDTD